MLASELKPMEEILSYLDGEDKVYVVGCKGCAEACQTGGEAHVAEMVAKLKEAGKRITGSSTIDMMCNDTLTRTRFALDAERVLAADSLLALSCGIGIQTAAEAVMRPVHPGCNTVYLGGGHAEWQEGAGLCLECGECVLDYTGGICPIARCAKQLLNGPCGGSQGGKCEVSKDLLCAWQLIVDRLTALGQLEKLEKIAPAKDWSRTTAGGPPRTIR
jgi:ferredoxin